MNYKDIEIFLHIIFPLNGKSYSYVKKDIYFYEIFDNRHSIGEFNNPFSDTRLNIHQEIDELDQFKKLAYDLIVSYERNLLIDEINK